MQTFLLFLIVLVALATLYVLARGVIGMATGKDFTGVRSQSFMRQRVMLQSVAILLAALLMMVGRSA